MAETSSISRDNVNIAITPQPSIKTLFFLQHRNNRKLSIAVFDWRMGFPTPHTGNETARSHSTARNKQLSHQLYAHCLYLLYFEQLLCIVFVC
eukprot:m.207479 g.207479  ORF g.207479 m.207479 type:complete len:93 (+) comp13762_c0_seq25:1671-1949(+)